MGPRAPRCRRSPRDPKRLTTRRDALRKPTDKRNPLNFSPKNPSLRSKAPIAVPPLSARNRRYGLQDSMLGRISLGRNAPDTELSAFRPTRGSSARRPSAWHSQCRQDCGGRRLRRAWKLGPLQNGSPQRQRQCGHLLHLRVTSAQIWRGSSLCRSVILPVLSHDRWCRRFANQPL